MSLATGSVLATGVAMLAALWAALYFHRRAQAAETELTRQRQARDTAEALTKIQR